MNINRFALSAALLATTGLVPVSTALAQDENDDVIVVRYQYIPEDKRVTSEVSSFLSIDDIAVTGDADIASALGRVTGLSVQDGRFVIVRGLNERYSNTLINGSPLASPEPLRRAVPLDLFPTSLISNILVQKTFSPQFPGEFGGGLVEIETSTIPTERFFEFGVGFSGDTKTTFTRGLQHTGGGYDWTGFDDGTRDWPEGFYDLWNTTNIDSSVDSTTRAKLGRALENSKLWVVQEGDTPMNGSFDFSAGERIDLDSGLSIGLLVSGGFDNSWTTRVGSRGKARVSGDTLSARSDFDRFQTENVIESNAMFGVGVGNDNHELTGLAFVLRSTEKETQILEGQDDDRDAQIRTDSTAWYERQVYTYQIAGDHTFDIGNGVDLEWRFSTSDASREAPNSREAVYEDQDSSEDSVNYQLLNALDGNAIVFSRVDDTTDDYGFDLTIPTELFGSEMDIKLGYANTSKDRFAYTREFGFDGSIPADLLDSRIDYIYADQNILDSRFFLAETGGTLFPEAYRGELDVEGLYFGADMALGPFLRAALGVRFEDATQTLETFNLPLTGGVNVNTPIEEDYVLPAATLTWTFGDNLQARFGYSETVTRPQFRELGFASFVNAETGESFRGNPFLTNTEITNYDARLEYYFGRDQFVTAGVFYKELDAPIVEYILPEGETLATSFLNAPEATLAGFELEYEKTFEMAETFGDFWEDAELFIKANYTYTSSEMTAGSDATVIIANPQAGQAEATVQGADGYITDGEALQGQSEHLANLQIGIENDDNRTALLVNYTGERTRALANVAVGLPSVIEEPPMTVDLVHSRSFEHGDGTYDVRFAVRNLFGEDYVATQSSGGTSLVVDQYDIGTTFSVSLKRSF
jgi:outer membrane receptor protein involved in Fe transport